ncbi:unnamed protein product [Adineta steineri]|uniref:G-protein coupled receptors family 1 profile domain-containing protein n=1 Tax=Adineta steineri TaxID=433720 RepID=A0A818U7K2_9BILA|nr:unnamed protein product [Adineta steineri]CAF3694530.1 unnamed protein product [Adineta steineri]
MATQSIFQYVCQQVVIYVGLFLFIAGLISGLLTLLVFLSLRTFRQKSCAFYLTIMSLVNTFHLFTGLFTYIMINGFGINWLNMSLFYCKFRPFYVQLCTLISFSCMCLATIDQFFATCSYIRWQRLSNIKLARYILIVVTLAAILHGIPSIFSYGHISSPTTGENNCIIMNTAFRKYYYYFYVPVLQSTLPISIMILFGILAYRNVQQIAFRTIPLVRRELDKQLTTMVLVQIFYDAIVVTPSVFINIIMTIYGSTSNSLLAAQLDSISVLGIILYYFHYAGSFYIYVCVSKRFRQQFLYVLSTIHVTQCCRLTINNNQIQTETS